MGALYKDNILPIPYFSSPFSSLYEKVKKLTNKSYDQLYVIGDTVLDIQTARHLGAKSIAIATGSHSREKLLTENPDYCIDRFNEVRHLFFK